MRKNVISGIGFLVAAAFVILGSMGVFGDISVWTLLLTFVLVYWFVKAALKLQWPTMLFSLAFLAILYDEMLGIENLTPWPVLGAAFLGSIGCCLIFKKTNKFVDENGRQCWTYDGGEGFQSVDQEEDEHRFICDVSFGSVTKYIKCTSLQEVVVDNSFGQVAVYFDEAILDGGRANVMVDNSFGNVKLYIPSDWNVVIKADESFGHVRSFKSEGIMNCVIEGGNKLYVNADTSFGDIEIHYI